MPARSKLVAFGLVSLAGFALSACDETANDPAKQIGANPTLPAPHEYLLPPMHIATRVPWGDETPTVPASKSRRLPAISRTRDRSTRCRTATSWSSQGDVGYVPVTLPHYVENTGADDIVFLEMFKAPTYADVSLNNWLAAVPPEMVRQHLSLAPDVLAGIPKGNSGVVPPRV